MPFSLANVVCVCSKERLIRRRRGTWRMILVKDSKSKSRQKSCRIWAVMANIHIGKSGHKGFYPVHSLKLRETLRATMAHNHVGVQTSQNGGIQARHTIYYLHFRGNLCWALLLHFPVTASWPFSFRLLFEFCALPSGQKNFTFDSMKFDPLRKLGATFAFFEIFYFLRDVHLPSILGALLHSFPLVIAWPRGQVGLA